MDRNDLSDDMLKVVDAVAAWDGVPTVKEFDTNRPPGVMGYKSVAKHGYSWGDVLKLAGKFNECDRECILQQVRQVILTLAEDGVAPTRIEYDKHRGKLPTSKSIENWGLTINMLAQQVGLKPRPVGIGTGQRVVTYSNAMLHRIWLATEHPLTEGDLLNVSAEPPPGIDPKLSWSMGGMMACHAYTNRRGEVVHVLR